MGLTIGLTGGIGSGKSTLAALLVRCGAWLVDTDAIARALTATGGSALPALARAFGPAIIGSDGALDREHMRRLVFADTDAKLRLEGILHPQIGIEALRQAALAGTGQSVVFDVPLLAESRLWRRRMDRILVIDCAPEVQMARVIARSGWDADAVRRVIAQQASRTKRRAIADAMIDNGAQTSLAQLGGEVQALWHAWHPPVEQ